MGEETLHRGVKKKDIGMTDADRMSPDKHINRVAGEILNLLKYIRTSFATDLCIVNLT